MNIDLLFVVTAVGSHRHRDTEHLRACGFPEGVTNVYINFRFLFETPPKYSNGPYNNNDEENHGTLVALPSIVTVWTLKSDGNDTMVK